jgi:hypothetical protein
MPNVNSNQKQLILVVTVASFIAANWFRYEEAPRDYAAIQPFLGTLGMSVAGIEAFQAEYRQLIQKDKLYLECQNLIAE